MWGKAYSYIFSYLLAREKGYWSASRLGYPLGTSWRGPQGRWDSLERSRIHHDAAADSDGNHLVSPLLNLLKRDVISRTARFNIKKFYMVLILCLSVVYGRFPRTTLTDRFCITEVESVYGAVRTESLYKADMCRYTTLTLWRRNFLLNFSTPCI